MKTVTVFFCVLFAICFFSFLSCKNNYTYTNFTVTVTHPDSNANGKKVILEIDSHLLPSPLLLHDTFKGNSVIFETGIPDQCLEDDSTRIYIIASLAGEPENDNIDMQVYKNIPTAFYHFLLTKTHYTGIKSMVKQTFILERDGSRSFNVEFPANFNIQIDYEDYLPEISWNAYPGSGLDRYRYAVLVNDDRMYYTSDWKIGNTTWMIGASDSTKNISVRVPSAYFRLHGGHGSEGIVIPPTIVPGDVFKIEVYAEIINRPFKNILMDSVTIYYE